MKTFKKLFGLCLLLSSLNLCGQNTHEVGIRFSGISFSGLNNFNLLYKKGKGENKFTRYRIGVARFQFTKNDAENKATNVSLGFGIGFERRKKIVDQLFFIHGFEPALQVNYHSSNGNNTYQFTPRIGYILGIQKDFSNNLSLSLETIPSIAASFNRNNSSNDNHFNSYSIQGGFSTNLLSIGLTYRFKK